MPFEIGSNSNTVKMILGGLAVIGAGYAFKNSDKIFIETNVFPGKSTRKTRRKRSKSRSKSRRKTKTPSTPRNSKGQLQMV